MRKAAATKLSIATMVGLVCSIGAVHSSPKEEHEQQYIVGSIGKDVSEILLFAARKVGKQEKPIDFLTNENTSDLEHRSYALVLNDSGETFAQDISLAEYVWSPSNFTPWAQQFIKKFSLQPTKSTDEKSTRDFIEALSNFDTEVLAEQNKKVSTLLTEHPLDAELHEQAALLCAVFGLRESASCFTDVRSWLNRIATHLTMAQALRGNSAYGNAGKLAEIAMLCLCGRQADAVAHIDKVDSAQNSPEMKSWLRALRIRATTDYRIADVQTATVVERLEHGRALADNLSADKLTDELRRHKPVGSPIDWLRIGMRGIASVESGHVYAEPAIAAELADYSLELKLYNDKKILNNSEATEALNQQPTGCLIREPAAHLQAISWGDLSAFHARQLLDGVYQKYYFEKRMWGVPEQAASTLAQADKNVSTLDLYPLCKLSMLKASQEKIDQSLSASVAKLLNSHPEEVNSDLWHRAKDSVPVIYGRIVDPYTYFVPRFPYGTAFDISNRNAKTDEELSSTEIDRLFKLSPYSAVLANVWARSKYRNNVTGEQLAAAYGPLADFNVHALATIAAANKNDHQKYISSLEKLAKYDAQYYFKLGAIFVEDHQDLKAVDAYENGVKFCRNGVTVANECRWLVDYYYDHGMKERALALAKDAAEVYSNRGLHTLASLYERMGNLQGAEEYYQKIDERYNQHGDLCKFYLNHEYVDPRYREKGRKLFDQLFPGGLPRLQATDLQNQPEKGIRVASSSANSERYGLKIGDIIVGIDGAQIKDATQYYYARGLHEKSPNLELTFWNGSKYTTITQNIPDHRLGCKIVDYLKKK